MGKMISDIIKQELVKCKKDPVYFISKYIKIEEAGGSVDIPLYPKQIEVVRTFMKDHYTIILKSRQIGISTIVQAILDYLVLFHKNITIGVVSKDGPEATDFVRKAKLMIDDLPPFLKPSYEKETQQSIELFNRSRIVSAPVNLSNPSGTLRGKSLTTLVIDEAAFIRHIREAYNAMIPAVFKAQQAASQKGIPYGIFIISTPNRTTGIGQWYYEQWKDSIEQNSIYTPVRIHYSDAPFATGDWIDKQKKLLKDPAVIDQELELKFVTSKDALFSDPIVVKEMTKSQEPIEKRPVTYISKFGNSYTVGKGEWYIWEHNDPHKTYLLGADIASITGECESAIEVTDSNLNQVAEFSGKLRISDFEKEIIKISQEYPNIVVIVEANSYGSRTVETLAENPEISMKLFYTRIKDPKTGKITKVLPGLYTTGKTRPLIYESLYWSVRENPARVRSERLALELQGINKDFTSKQLSDLVMSEGFICYVKKYESKYLNTELSDVSSDVLHDVLELHGNTEEKKYNNLEDEVIDIFS